MSGICFKKIFLLLLLISAVNLSIYAQSDSDLIPPINTVTDTLFQEIILSDDGVAAVDSDGNDWYYDFEKDMFVPGLLERSTSLQQTIEDNEPVETRCVFEKKVILSSDNVTIDVDEFVQQDIITFGRVTVKGWVKGNIISYKNRVIVKTTGQVDGNITAPKIIVHDGAIVLGELNEGLLNVPSLPTDLSGDGFLAIMIIMSTLAVFLFLITALIPKKLEIVSNCFNRYKLRSTFLGLLFFFMMPLVIVLAIISIIGIVAVPFIPFAYLFASVLGIASFSFSIGNFVFGRFLSSGEKFFMKLFLGFSLISIAWIIGITFMTGSEDPEKFGIGVFFFVISILFSIVPVFGGIGAVVLTRFGFRPYVSWKDKVAENPQILTPAPPPMPKPPEIRTPPRHPENF